jgi:hypothetical protein
MTYPCVVPKRGLGKPTASTRADTTGSVSDSEKLPDLRLAALFFRAPIIVLGLPPISPSTSEIWRRLGAGVAAEMRKFGAFGVLRSSKIVVVRDWQCNHKPQLQDAGASASSFAARATSPATISSVGLTRFSSITMRALRS